MSTDHPRRPLTDSIILQVRHRIASLPETSIPRAVPHSDISPTHPTPERGSHGLIVHRMRPTTARLLAINADREAA